MTVAVVALAVLAVAAGFGWLLDRRRLRRRIERLDARLLEALDDAAGARGALSSATEEATAAAAAARAEAEAARREATEATAALGPAVARADQAEALAGRLRARTWALWQLERLRTERTWRNDVSPFPGAPSPLDGPADPLAAAVTVSGSATREEAGVHVEVAWDLPPQPDPGRALVVLRAAQEALAAIAKTAETATVRASTSAGRVELALEARDAEGATVALPEEVVDALAPVDDVALRAGPAPGRTLPT